MDVHLKFVSKDYYVLLGLYQHHTFPILGPPLQTYVGTKDAMMGIELLGKG